MRKTACVPPVVLLKGVNNKFKLSSLKEIPIKRHEITVETLRNTFNDIPIKRHEISVEKLRDNF